MCIFVEEMFICVRIDAFLCGDVTSALSPVTRDQKQFRCHERGLIEEMAGCGREHRAAEGESAHRRQRKGVKDDSVEMKPREIPLVISSRGIKFLRVSVTKEQSMEGCGDVKEVLRWCEAVSWEQYSLSWSPHGISVDMEMGGHRTAGVALSAQRLHFRP